MNELMSLDKYMKRNSVSYSKNISVSHEKIWDLISSPSNLERCHPYCKSNEINKWSNGNYNDELTYLNGLTYVRNFLDWNPGKGYDLLIGESDGPQSYVIWEITQISERKCNLKITVYPYILANWGRFLSYLPFKIWIKPRLKKYLYSVISGFEYVIMNEEPIPRNYFGEHPWFS